MDRLIQGLGVGATASLFRAVLRDCFSGDELSKFISFISNGIIAMTVAAPFIGGYIQQYLGWRSTFLFLLVYSLCVMVLLLCRFEETNTSHEKSKLDVVFIVKSYKDVVGSRLFLGYSLCVFLTYGGLFSWITAASPILIKLVGVSPVMFGYLMLLTAFSTATGSNINGLLVTKVGAKNLMLAGWCIMTIAGLLMMLLSFFFTINVFIIMIPILIYIVGSTLIWGNAVALAFEPFSHIAGYAAAVYGCVQIIGGAVFSYILSTIVETSQLPLAAMLAGSGFTALMSYYFIAKPAAQ